MPKPLEESLKEIEARPRTVAEIYQSLSPEEQEIFKRDFTEHAYAACNAILSKYGGKEAALTMLAQYESIVKAKTEAEKRVSELEIQLKDSGTETTQINQQLQEAQTELNKLKQEFEKYQTDATKLYQDTEKDRQEALRRVGKLETELREQSEAHQQELSQKEEGYQENLNAQAKAHQQELSQKEEEYRGKISAAEERAKQAEANLDELTKGADKMFQELITGTFADAPEPETSE